MAKQVAGRDDGRRNKKPMAEPAMPEQEAIRLATEAIRRGRAIIPGEAWATYVDGEEWHLDKLGLPGNYWYVHFALAEVP